MSNTVYSEKQTEVHVTLSEGTLKEGTSKRDEVENRNVPTLALVAVLLLLISQGALFVIASDDLIAGGGL